MFTPIKTIQTRIWSSSISSTDYEIFSSFSEIYGSPKYRRRTPEEGGWRSKVRMKFNKIWFNYKYTSKGVVLHNLWLLEKFDCHINVDTCSRLKVIKYLLWYPFKGDNRDKCPVWIVKDERTQY